MMQQAKRFLRIAGWTLWMAMGVVVSAHWVNAKSPEQAVILKDRDPRFTGVSTRMEPTNLNVSRRHFDSSARSAWHSHEHGQLLFVEEGRARTQKRGEPMKEMGPGRATTPHRWWSTGTARRPMSLSCRCMSASAAASRGSRRPTDEQYNGTAR